MDSPKLRLTKKEKLEVGTNELLISGRVEINRRKGENK